MKRVVVISSAPLVSQNKHFNLYRPYEKEMKLWAQYSDTIQFCCPVWQSDRNLLIEPISFQMEEPILLKEFDTTSFLNTLKAIPLVFVNCYRIYKVMRQVDHIHLRCPGNIGLLGAIVQIAFPKKKKTAKYAGNWDPKAKQPFTYKMQRWLLSNTFLTRNMQVLVYGDWPNQSANIKPFFTATYSEKEIQTGPFHLRGESRVLKKDCNATEAVELPRTETRNTQNYKFIFVGTFSKGKQPLYAIKLVAQLQQNGINASLDLYGEGVLREELQNHLKSNHLEAYISLKGNQSREIIKNAYQTSHFLILPSKSEGWPKAVAEAMFWGCVPLVTPVSCVPFMVDFGNRGLLLAENLAIDTTKILQLLSDPGVYHLKSDAAANWSQHYTVELFEEEIRKLLAD